MKVSLYIRWSDVTVISGHYTISMLWGNTAYCMKLSGEDLYYLNKITTVGLRKCPFLQRAQCSHCKRCISYGNSVCLSVCPSVCLSVCPSVTRRYCVKTTARSTVQFALSDSKMCLVLYKPKNIPQGRPLPPEILAQSDHSWRLRVLTRFAL